MIFKGAIIQLLITIDDIAVGYVVGQVYGPTEAAAIRTHVPEEGMDAGGPGEASSSISSVQ